MKTNKENDDELSRSSGVGELKRKKGFFCYCPILGLVTRLKKKPKQTNPQLAVNIDGIDSKALQRPCKHWRDFQSPQNLLRWETSSAVYFK